MKPSSEGAMGGSLVELIVALSLGAVVVGSLATLMSSGSRWTRSLADRVEAQEVARTIWAVLEEELRVGRVNTDWRVESAGSIRLRSFQGLARVCEGSSARGAWLVAYRGRRAPDPSRDSLLVLEVDGSWRALALDSSARSDGCNPLPGESIYRWDLPWTGDVMPVLARTFETGSYHLADGAFRYRRGRGGRQPLTVERLASTSRFEPLADGVAMSVELIGSRPSDPVRVYRWITRPPSRDP